MQVVPSLTSMLSFVLIFLCLYPLDVGFLCYDTGELRRRQLNKLGGVVCRGVGARNPPSYDYGMMLSLDSFVSVHTILRRRICHATRLSTGKVGTFIYFCCTLHYPSVDYPYSIGKSGLGRELGRRGFERGSSHYGGSGGD